MYLSFFSFLSKGAMSKSLAAGVVATQDIKIFHTLLREATDMKDPYILHSLCDVVVMIMSILFDTLR